jgi:hypothetical protein
VKDFLTFKIKQMEKQEQKLTSVEYLLDIIDNLLGDKIAYDVFIFSQICVEAREKYENELKESFEKGYEEGVKYTDGLISDEKFPF